MKDGALVAEPRLARAELLEVFCSLGHDAAVQPNFDATCRFATNTNIKVDGVRYFCLGFPEKTLKHATNLEGCCTDVLLLKHWLGCESHAHRGACNERKDRIESRNEHDGNKN